MPTAIVDKNCRRGVGVCTSSTGEPAQKIAAPSVLNSEVATSLIQKLLFGLQHRQRKIFSSQEDAIFIAKSENASADNMLLEDDIPEDFSIKMHTVR